MASSSESRKNRALVDGLCSPSSGAVDPGHLERLVNDVGLVSAQAVVAVAVSVKYNGAGAGAYGSAGSNTPPT